MSYVSKNHVRNRPTPRNSRTIAQSAEPEVDGADLLHSAIQYGDGGICGVPADPGAAALGNSCPIFEHMHAGHDLRCYHLRIDSDGR